MMTMTSRTLTRTLALIMVAACALGLAGCAALGDAGHTGIELTAVQDSTGKVQGHNLRVTDGKELAGRGIVFTSAGGTTSFALTEGASRAFQGQGIAAKAIPVPTTGLQELLK